jgi:RNA polymerase sigma-70 factor (ECF subfamily)
MKETERQQILDSWLDQHRALLFKVVRAYAFTAADQDDLFQEIVIQVWRSIPNFKKQSAVTTWLYRIALNTALVWTRKENKHQRGKETLDQSEPILQERSGPLDPRLDWLYEQIARLNEIDRSLMLLLLDGFSYREMSNILGISESNVGVKISRIKKHLASQSKTVQDDGL